MKLVDFNYDSLLVVPSWSTVPDDDRLKGNIMKLNVYKIEDYFYYRPNDLDGICSKIVITAYGQFVNISIYVADILIAKMNSINCDDSDELLTDFVKYAMSSLNDYCSEKEFRICKRLYDREFEKLRSQLSNRYRIADEAVYEAIKQDLLF